jgi:hypothetical protein
MPPKKKEVKPVEVIEEVKPVEPIKKKRVLTDKQREALQRGREIRMQNQQKQKQQS